MCPCYSFLHPTLCHLQTLSAAILSLPLHSGILSNGTVHSATTCAVPDSVRCTFGLRFPYRVVSLPCSSHRLDTELVLIKYPFKIVILRCVSCRFFWWILSPLLLFTKNTLSSLKYFRHWRLVFYFIKRTDTVWVVSLWIYNWLHLITAL